jgi:hypothetical protein
MPVGAGRRGLGRLRRRCGAIGRPGPVRVELDQGRTQIVRLLDHSDADLVGELEVDGRT